MSYGTSLVDLVRGPDGRVRGIVARGQSGWTRQIGAHVIVGADGLRSTVARLVGAGLTHGGASASANIFGYWADVPADGYRWYYHPGLSVGAIPTNDGRTCILDSGVTDPNTQKGRSSCGSI